jgi:hypothetical protein
MQAYSKKMQDTSCEKQYQVSSIEYRAKKRKRKKGKEKKYRKRG